MVRQRGPALLSSCPASLSAALAVWPLEPQRSKSCLTFVGFGWVGQSAPSSPQASRLHWELKPVRPTLLFTHLHSSY
eukprot:3375799-Rhodomonas_salina.1